MSRTFSFRNDFELPTSKALIVTREAKRRQNNDFDCSYLLGRLNEYGDHTFEPSPTAYRLAKRLMGE